MTTSSRVDTTTGHWQERWRGSVMDTYGTPAVALVRGEGARVWDADGRDYVDLLAGIAATSTVTPPPTKSAPSAVASSTASLVVAVIGAVDGIGVAATTTTMSCATCP